ncbi:hypothetical protein FB451DRAFT_1208303 [Mycena latifolia]|nr:hypothetical protein FB451DRAFT_1208303 [Mycena latifolia]
MKLTELGQDILLEICAQVFEDSPRDRVILSWLGESRQESAQPRIFPGPPAKILLDLALMHSELAAATRPYIWREVLVVFGSYDATERGLGRLERAQKPHIAPFVRVLFLSFRFLGDAEDHLPLIVNAIPRFVSLRGVCLGVFQSYSQPRMYEDVAKAIREHPTIDTLSVRLMTRCANLIAKDSAKRYSLELTYCHDNSAALLLRPKAIKFFRLENYENQNLKKNWPVDIWDSLQHLDPGHDDMAHYPPENHKIMLSSLQKYLKQGRRPALKSLDLSKVASYELPRWLALVHGLDLEAFAYVPYSDGDGDFDLLAEILDKVPKVRTLSVKLPTEEYPDPDDEDEDEEREFEIDPDIVDLLSGLPNLERLTLTVRLPYDFADILEDPEDASDLGQLAVEALAEECVLLRRVRLVFRWEEMDECMDEPAIVEYIIHRKGPTGEVVVESVAPRLLEGTILEFVQWR